MPSASAKPSPNSHLPSSEAKLLSGLKICFVAGTLGQGGAERQLYYNLKCLIECGARVDLLCLTQGEFWEQPISKLGVTIHYVGGNSSTLVRLLKIFQVVRRLRPQVMQCQHFYTGIYGAVTGRCLGIPSIGAVRNDGFSELKANGWFLGPLSVRLPNLLVANSERAIQNLRSRGYRPEKFLLLPNVIDTETFRPEPKSRTENEFVILGVGSLERAKRFDRWLAIAAELGGRIQCKLRVIIAGDGRERATIETLAERTRAKGVRVELSGRVADPRPLFQKADVLLLTSDREGTPNVIMEAMACGLPVVAANVGGVAALVKHGETGFLFEPEEHSVAVTALERLAAEPGLAQKIGLRSRAFIEQHHSTRLLPNILSQLYGKILPARWDSSP